MTKNSTKFKYYLTVDEKGVLHLPNRVVKWIVTRYKLEKKTPRAQKMAIKRIVIAALKEGYKRVGKEIPKKA